MNKYLLIIQMYGESKEIRKTYDDYDDYEYNYVRELRNVDLGYKTMIVIDDDNGVEHHINPKYVAWTELHEKKV